MLELSGAPVRDVAGRRSRIEIAQARPGTPKRNRRRIRWVARELDPCEGSLSPQIGEWASTGDYLPGATAAMFKPMACDPKDMGSPIASWYEAERGEPDRLLSGRGRLEGARTKELVERYLPAGSLSII